MAIINWISRLKILVTLRKNEEALALQQDLECLGHRVQVCGDLSRALRWLREWQPDLLVTEETFGLEQPDAGIRLAEYCGIGRDDVNSWPGTRAMIFVPLPDWDRFKRAQRTGAHVVAKGTNFEAAIRYVQTIADRLVTDQMLGPALFGIHTFSSAGPNTVCDDCVWSGASVSYGTSRADLQLTPVRTALLNALLLRRRGQAPTAITNACRESRFLKRILRGRELRESAVKMEITRLRQDIGKALEVVGAPYAGEHFLPSVPHGTTSYCLTGNRRLIHVPSEDPAPQ